MILAERRRPAAFLVLLRGKRCGLSCTIRRKREASCYYTENPEASRSAAIQRSFGPDMQGLVPLLDHRWESRHLRNDRTRLRLQPNPVLARMASPFMAGEVCVLHDGSAPSHINAVILKKFHKTPQTPTHNSSLAIRRVIRLMDETSIQASDDAMEASQSLTRRRHRLSHARVRSTPRRRGRTTKPVRSDRLMISIVSRSMCATAVSSFWPA